MFQKTICKEGEDLNERKLFCLELMWRCFSRQSPLLCPLSLYSQSLEELRYLPELRTLNIGYNPKILHLESHIVKGKLTKLQALICNECGFKSVSFLKFCTNLNTLILSSNSLTVFPTSNDFSLSGLTKLSLSKNNLKQIPNLSVCVNLQELRINNNEITSLSDTITMAPKLKILEISNNLIDSWESVEFLLKLQYLTNLSLAGAWRGHVNNEHTFLCVNNSMSLWTGRPVSCFCPLS